MNTNNWEVRHAYYTAKQRELEEIIGRSEDVQAVRNAKRTLARWAREDRQRSA